MIASLTLLLLCQLVGEVVARTLAWPVPGPVLGMIVMLVLLALRPVVGRVLPGFGQGLDATGRGLLSHLSLLFVPAGVGIVQRLDVIGAHWLGLSVTLVVSTLLTLVATVGTFRVVSRLVGAGYEGESHE